MKPPPPHDTDPSPLMARAKILCAWQSHVTPFVPPIVIARWRYRGVGFCMRWGHG